MASADKSNYFMTSEFMEDDGHQLGDEGRLEILFQQKLALVAS
jgi:hypothetical protein